MEIRFSLLLMGINWKNSAISRWSQASARRTVSRWLWPFRGEKINGRNSRVLLMTTGVSLIKKYGDCAGWHKLCNNFYWAANRAKGRKTGIHQGGRAVSVCWTGSRAPWGGVQWSGSRGPYSGGHGQTEGDGWGTVVACKPGGIPHPWRDMGEDVAACDRYTPQGSCHRRVHPWETLQKGKYLMTPNPDKISCRSNDQCIGSLLGSVPTCS